MGVVCVWRGNSLTFVILSIWMDGSFQFCIWKKAIIIHHWSFLIHHSSFVIHEILNHSSSIIRHSSFIIHHSSSIIIHHSALIIVHSAGIICHSLFQKSMKNRWEIYQNSIKNGPKINAKATKIGLGPPWSRLGGVQAVMEASKTLLRVNSWILLSLSNEMAILAKNGDFVREWEQCQKWPRKVKIESIPKVRRVLARADGRAGSYGLQLGSQGRPKRIRKSR